MQNLVLDLMNNSGGYLGVAVQIIDELLADNALIVYTEGNNQNKKEYYASEKGDFENGITTKLRLSNEASMVNDFYKGWKITFKTTTIYESRNIIKYYGSNKSSAIVAAPAPVGQEILYLTLETGGSVKANDIVKGDNISPV